ncbi:MAG: hypothetical protein V4653_00435 [Pseudomonadota bacterium]
MLLRLTLALALAGCGGLAAGPRSPLPDQERAIGELADGYSPAAITRCLAQPVEAQRSCRDTIAYSLMVAIDLRYAEYEGRFFDDTRYGEFGATTAVLGLTAAASVSSLGAANILAALAAGVTGGREAFSRDVLADRTATALLTAMRSERQRVALRIRRGLQQDPARYPLGWALSDLYGYYRAGTMPGALTAVTRAVGEQAQVAQDNITRQVITGQTAVETSPRGSVAVAEAASLRVAPRAAAVRPPVVSEGSARTDSAAALRSFFLAEGQPAATRQERLRAILRAAGEEGLPEIESGAVPVQALINDASPAGEERRSRIVRNLRLLP